MNQIWIVFGRLFKKSSTERNKTESQKMCGSQTIRKIYLAHDIQKVTHPCVDYTIDLSKIQYNKSVLQSLEKIIKFFIFQIY